MIVVIALFAFPKNPANESMGTNQNKLIIKDTLNRIINNQNIISPPKY